MATCLVVFQRHHGRACQTRLKPQIACNICLLSTRYLGSNVRLCLRCRRKVKTNMAKMWQKVYDQNYHKSLDHRSFYFKQARFTHALQAEK